MIAENLHSGFYQTTNGLTIDKSPNAELVYIFDWTEWMPDGPTISDVEYTITTRVNDPTPLIDNTHGKLTNNRTYIHLSSGALGKTYTISVKITLSSGWIEERFFRVNIINRSA